MEFLDQFFVNLKTRGLSLLHPFLPDWFILLVSISVIIVCIIALGPITMMYLTLLERKLIARIQNRYGPNRVGVFGLLQPVADGVKMFTKEDITPTRADKFIHLLAPIAIVVPALLIFAVIPFGRNMIATDLTIGILFLIALSSTTTIWVFAASWGSRNKFSLIGGMRSVAQIISYEIPMVLSVVPAILVSGSFSTVSIVEAQQGFHWFVFTPWGLLGFFLFFLTSVAEVNRTPFDLPEGESEIVAGFHTEYSGMKFAMFYMAEYMNVITMSAIVATVYLGGWQGPAFPSWFWFGVKIFFLICVMMWLRGTFPRFRVDQLMGFSWKVLLPLTFANLLATGLWAITTSPLNHLVAAGILLVSILIVYLANRRELPQKRIYRYADEGTKIIDSR